MGMTLGNIHTTVINKKHLVHPASTLPVVLLEPVWKLFIDQ
jgi:hypothetical protein